MPVFIVSFLLLLILPACNIGMVDLKRKVSAQSAEVSVARISLQGPSRVLYKVCSGPFQVSLEEPTGAEFLAAAETRVAVVIQSGKTVAQAKLYSDAECGLPTASVKIAKGKSSGQFYFYASVPQAFYIDASAEKMDADSLEVNVVRGAVALDLTGPGSVVLGDCSSAFQVTAKDIDGVISVVTAPTPVTLAASVGAGFFSSANCALGTEVSSVVIPAAQSSGTFFVRTPAAGTQTVSVSAEGLSPAQRSLATTLEVRRLTLEGAQSGYLAHCLPMTLSLRDGAGNLFATPNMYQVNIGHQIAGTTGGSFHRHDPNVAPCSDASVSVLNVSPGRSSVEFYFRAIEAKNYQLVARAGNLLSPAKSVSIARVLAAVEVSFDRTVSVGVGTPVLVTVAAKDAVGLDFVTPAPGVRVQLAVSGGGTLYGAYASGTFSNPIGNEIVLSGTARRTMYLRPEGLGSVSVRATAVVAPSAPAVNSGVASLTAIQTFESLHLSGGTGPAVATNCSAPLGVMLKDGLGNPIRPAQPTSVTMLGAGVGSFYASRPCAPPSTNSVQVDENSGSAVVHYMSPSGESSLSFSARATYAGVTRTSNSIPFQVITLPLRPDSTFRVLPNGREGFVSFSAPSKFLGTVVQPDSKILAVGSVVAGGVESAIVVRYLPDSTIDASFGVQGMVILALGSNGSRARSVFLEGSDILVGGDFTGPSSQDVFAVKLSSAGTLREDFGTGGVLRLDAGGGDELVKFKKWGNARYAFLLKRTQESVVNTVVAASLLNGAIDVAGFGSAGIAVYPEITEPGDFLPDGADALLTGSVLQGGQSHDDLVLMKISSSGGKYPNYGGAEAVEGVLIRDLGRNENDRPTVMISLGSSLFIAGYSTQGASSSSFLARFNRATGTQFPGFGVNGVSYFDVSVTQATERVVDAVVASDSQHIFLLGRHFGHNAFIVRLNQSGQVAGPGGDGQGWLEFSFGSGQSMVTGLALAPNGKPVVSGWAMGDNAAYLARFYNY